jgi:hypothetical protein
VTLRRLLTISVMLMSANVLAKPAVAVSCVETLVQGHLGVQIAVRNLSRGTVHVVDGHRMPYAQRQPDGAVSVFSLVNPHNDEDMLPPILDLPTSRALQPGETMTLTRTLDPFLQSEHWSWDNKPTPLHGNVTVRCRVAWGRQPLPPANRPIGLDYVLKWQQIAQAKPIVIKFPE